MKCVYEMHDALFAEDEPDVQPQPISSEQVRQMMENAQKMIEERKRMLNLDQRIPIFNKSQGTQVHANSQRDWKFARFGRYLLLTV